MRSLAALLLATVLAAPGFAGDAEPPQVAVYPAEIELSTSRDRQSYVVQLTTADGVTRDVTDAAAVELSAPVAERRGNVLFPKADGTATMTVSYGGRVLPVPVTVRQAAT